MTEGKEKVMEKPYTIHVNLDAKCERCGKGGAMQNGICMSCMAKAIKNGELDHILNRNKPKLRRR